MPPLTVVAILLLTAAAASLDPGWTAAPEAPEATAAPAAPAATAALSWEVLSRRPHDAAAWTQGLQLDDAGRLFESTGLRGRSTIREVDPASGALLRIADLPDDQFGEGLALVEDRLIQLTWQEGLARVWDAATFEPLGTFAYQGEGWGLCYDGQRLVMSDGSDRLTFRDAETFEVTGSVRIEHAVEPALRLNELECVDGLVWANVWLTDTIVRIDPALGQVTGTLDLAGILGQPQAIGEEAPDVLNGIAWDAATGTFLVTGKRWPELIEIRVSDPLSACSVSRPGASTGEGQARQPGHLEARSEEAPGQRLGGVFRL